jgi:hypothetical protein
MECIQFMPPSNCFVRCADCDKIYTQQDVSGGKSSEFSSGGHSFESTPGHKNIPN